MQASFEEAIRCSVSATTTTTTTASEEKEEFEAYKQYIQQAKTLEEENGRKRDWFLKKTDEVFSQEFKGFEFDIDDKKVVFSPGDATELKKLQSTPTNFINKFTNNGLDGYRIEYLNNDGTKIPNLYRIITSSFIAEPVQINTPNSSQKSIKYIYNNPPLVKG